METYKVRRRISKMKCQKTRRNNSKLPAFKADTCPNKRKMGKDGMYVSRELSNGIWAWKKI